MMDEGLAIVPCTDVTCDAPATVAWRWEDQYAGPEGNGIIPGMRVNCAAGHWYTQWGDPIIDPDSPEGVGP